MRTTTTSVQKPNCTVNPWRLGRSLLAASLAFWVLLPMARAQSDDDFFEGDAFDEPGLAEVGQEAEGEIDVTYFYDKLADDGDWMWTPEYDWVWKPRGVAETWRPFTYGHWVHTELGWTWASYFSWGWAPFHYGNWAYLKPIGWIWVPGTVWHPARVMWRYSDGYVGWAPLLPGYDPWWGWAYYPVYYNHWIFLDWGHFCDDHPQHHYVQPRQVRDVFHHTQYPRSCRDRSSPACIRGPREPAVAKRVQTAIPTYKIRDTQALNPNGPVHPAVVNGTNLNVYRPKAQTRFHEAGSADPGAPSPRPRIDLGVVPNATGSRFGGVPNRANFQDPASRSTGAQGQAGSLPDMNRRPEQGKAIHPQAPGMSPAASMPSGSSSSWSTGGAARSGSSSRTPAATIRGGGSSQGNRSSIGLPSAPSSSGRSSGSSTPALRAPSRSSSSPAVRAPSSSSSSSSKASSSSSSSSSSKNSSGSSSKSSSSRKK